MKKNLKIVSAAAAALLAVAPVAATAVTANADVTVNGDTTSTTTNKAADVKVNFSLTATAGKTMAQDAINSVKVSANGATVNNIPASAITLEKFNSTTNAWDAVNPNSTTPLTAGEYHIVVNGLKLSGLTTGTSHQYTVSGGTFASHTATDKFTAEQLNAGAGNFTSDSFTLTDANIKGDPYFVRTGQNAVLPSYSLTPSADTASAVLSDLKSQLTPKGGSDQNTAASYPTENDIKSELKAQNVKVNDDGTFDAPATNVTINYTVGFLNGKKATIPVTIVAQQASAPKIYAAGASDTRPVNPTGTNTYTWKQEIKPGASFSAQTVANAFKAQISQSDPTNVDVKVDSSNLDVNKPGTYTVVLKATNPAGKTTKATVTVKVGVEGAVYKEVKQDGTVYTLNGNKVTATKDSVSKDTTVATFGDPVTIDGKSYVKINTKDGNQYVESKVFSEAPESNKHVRVWNKKESYIYNENHVRQGNGLRYKIGSGHNVYANENGTPKVYHVGGIDAYKLSDGYFKGHYVDVRNFTTKRVNNNHKKAVIRSRVFDVRGKVVKHMYINKGATIKVYGTKTIKGHKMYKIAKHNRYVKVANFR